MLQLVFVDGAAIPVHMPPLLASVPVKSAESAPTLPATLK